MRRLHLFQTHDQEWCPRTIRDAETDYQWDIGEVKNTAGPIPITYLVGLPTKRAN